MANPYQPQPSPYVTGPLPTGRPRMFNSSIAKAIWMLVPILTISVGAEVLILGIGTAVAGDGKAHSWEC